MCRPVKRLPLGAALFAEGERFDGHSAAEGAGFEERFPAVWAKRLGVVYFIETCGTLGERDNLFNVILAADFFVGNSAFLYEVDKQSKYEYHCGYGEVVQDRKQPDGDQEVDELF